jgi:hypothetical protein
MKFRERIEDAHFSVLKALVASIVIALNFSLAHASCVLVDLNEAVKAADEVFIATITNARISRRPTDMKDKERYQIHFSFEVIKRLKGQPKRVRSLVIHDQYHRPNIKTQWERAERTLLSPGQNVLVVSNGEKEVEFSSIGCTSSRYWDDDSRKIIAELLRLRVLSDFKR